MGAEWGYNESMRQVATFLMVFAAVGILEGGIPPRREEGFGDG